MIPPMTTRIESLIEARGVLLSDGAMGTELFEKGLSGGSVPNHGTSPTRMRSAR